MHYIDLFVHNVRRIWHVLKNKIAHSYYQYGRFQEKITRRGSSYNSLGFRGDIDENEMRFLNNMIFLFNRQYDLSAAAGKI